MSLLFSNFADRWKLRIFGFNIDYPVSDCEKLYRRMCPPVASDIDGNVLTKRQHHPRAAVALRLVIECAEEVKRSCVSIHDDIVYCIKTLNPHPSNPASGYKRGSSLSSGPLRGESPPKGKDAYRFKRYWIPDHAFGANSAL